MWLAVACIKGSERSRSIRTRDLHVATPVLQGLRPAKLPCNDGCDLDGERGEAVKEGDYPRRERENEPHEERQRRRKERRTEREGESERERGREREESGLISLSPVQNMHGSGVNKQILASGLVSLELMTADGSVLFAAPAVNPDLFKVRTNGWTFRRKGESAREWGKNGDTERERERERTRYLQPTSESVQTLQIAHVPPLALGPPRTGPPPQTEGGLGSIGISSPWIISFFHGLTAMSGIRALSRSPNIYP